MKNLTVLAVVLATCLTAPSAFSLGLFLIHSATITQLDVDSYRVRVNVHWAGEKIFPPPDDPNYLGGGRPYFSTFILTTAVTPYNLYSIQNNFEFLSPDGDPYWSAPLVGPHTPGTLGNSFGFDFDLAGPLTTTPFSYMGGLDWYAPYLVDAGAGYTYVGAQHMASEIFYGQFAIGRTPEPGTFILLCAGLIGLVSLRKSR